MTIFATMLTSNCALQYQRRPRHIQRSLSQHRRKQSRKSPHHSRKNRSKPRQQLQTDKLSMKLKYLGSQFEFCIHISSIGDKKKHPFCKNLMKNIDWPKMRDVFYKPSHHNVIPLHYMITTEDDRVQIRRPLS